jgi:hypothetical protein
MNQETRYLGDLPEGSVHDYEDIGDEEATQKCAMQ